MVWAIVFAPVSTRFPGIFVALQTLMSLILPPTFGILLLGVLWRRTTRNAGLIGLLTGVVGWILMFLLSDSLFNVAEPFLYLAWWAFVLTVTTTVVVSLFSPPETDESLQGLVFTLDPTPEKVEEGGHS
jgi:SSS family solute:Na+ symporter